MNTFYALIKCATVGLVAGCLASVGSDLGDQILPLAMLLASITAVMVVLLLTAAPAIDTNPNLVTLDLTHLQPRS